MLLSLPTSAKQLPKPRPTRAGWHSHENQGRAAPACAAQPLELAAEPCEAERSRARGAQRERSAEQEHSPASPGPAQPDRDLAQLKPSPSLRPSENLLLPAGLFPAIYGAGLTRCPCERPSPGKQLPRACSPNRGALLVLLPCPTVRTQTRPTPALVAEACTLQVTLLGMLLPFSVLLPAPHHSQPSCAAAALVALLSKGFLGAGQGIFLTPSISTASGRLTGTGTELSAQIPAAEQEGWTCQGPSAFLPVRAEHGVWARLGIRRGFTACAVPGLSSRHHSPELSIWYLSPALKFN